MDAHILTLVENIAALMREKNLRMSVAESCTGGYISHLLTDLPGASQFFDLCVVSYSRHAKHAVLGVSNATINKFGMVSEETALEMAKSVKKTSKTGASLAVTGVAGPERLEEKDIGLVYIAVALDSITESKRLKITGTREEIKKQAAFEALQFFYHNLQLWT
ncbi:MAG: CinA family protein [Nitrospiraceae bacterium]|nr:MAG: CinA family protein [Nitrospiraceae bacterium]